MLLWPQAENGCFDSDTCDDNVLITSSIFLDTDLGSELDIFPNPTTGVINIKSDRDFEHYEIYSLNGQPLMRGESLTIDVNTLPSGLYLIMLTDKNGKKHTAKFMKN